MKPDSGKVLIHGRAYETVASRVARFREDKKDLWYGIVTEIIHRDDLTVVMKASIMSPEGKIMATGHAEEVRASSQINKTSALENAETSAIGRALAALGYVGTEFASADEVAQAIKQQGVHRPSDGAMESLEADMQTVVRDTASEVHLLMTEGKTDEALTWLEAAMLPAEAKIATWALLPSHFRTALKKAAEARKGTKGLIGMKNDIPA